MFYPFNQGAFNSFSVESRSCDNDGTIFPLPHVLINLLGFHFHVIQVGCIKLAILRVIYVEEILGEYAYLQIFLMMNYCFTYCR